MQGSVWKFVLDVWFILMAFSLGLLLYSAIKTKSKAVMKIVCLKQMGETVSREKF